MALKGHYEWYLSPRAGGQKMVKFVLNCDNMFQSETFDAAIFAQDQRMPPMMFRSLTLKAKQSVDFSFDTVDWTWCNGDVFAILGRNDSIKQQWPLALQTYAQGECPVCHGTHKCNQCVGRGFLYGPNNQIDRCPACQGTGACPACHMPQRSDGQQPGVPAGRDRHADSLRRQIAELQRKIEKTEWDLRIMDLHGQRSSTGAYSASSQLLHRYNMQMIELQHKLAQLENF